MREALGHVGDRLTAVPRETTHQAAELAHGGPTQAARWGQENLSQPDFKNNGFQGRADQGPGRTCPGSGWNSGSAVRRCRSSVADATAAASVRTAQIAKATCRPYPKACRAVPASSDPPWSGSRAAAATAPPRVSRAARAACWGTPGGRVPAIRLRYTAVPATPSSAIPSAPPTSALVSVIAVTAPARCGGAAATARSIASVSTGASATENTTDPVTSSARPAARLVPSCVSSPNP